MATTTIALIIVAIAVVAAIVFVALRGRLDPVPVAASDANDDPALSASGEAMIVSDVMPIASNEPGVPPGTALPTFRRDAAAPRKPSQVYEAPRQPEAARESEQASSDRAAAQSTYARDAAQSSHERDPAQSSHQRDPAQSSHERDPAQSSHERNPAQSSHERNPAQSSHERNPAQSSHERNPAQSSYERDSAQCQSELVEDCATQPADIRWTKRFDPRDGALDDATRLSLLRDLGIVRAPWGVPLLAQAYEEEPAAEHRRAALLALAAYRHPDAQPTFELALRADDDETRAIAANALSALRIRAALPS